MTTQRNIPWTPTGCHLPPKGTRVIWFGQHGEQVTGQITPVGRWVADANHNVPSHEIDYTPSHWRLMEVQTNG
jgi:hypothetical protein